MESLVDLNDCIKVSPSCVFLTGDYFGWWKEVLRARRALSPEVASARWTPRQIPPALLLNLTLGRGKNYNLWPNLSETVTTKNSQNCCEETLKWKYWILNTFIAQLCPYDVGHVVFSAFLHSVFTLVAKYIRVIPAPGFVIAGKWRNLNLGVIWLVKHLSSDKQWKWQCVHFLSALI